MLKKGYVASSDDLSLLSAKGMKIDHTTGLPPSAFDRPTLLARWIRIRPGLEEGIVFYAVTHTERGRLLVMSDRKQTRYYWLDASGRKTVLVDVPSRSFEDAWDNLFRGLIKTSAFEAQFFYKRVSHLLKAYFIEEGKPRMFTLEGTYKGSATSFVATVEWSPRHEDSLKVASTLINETHLYVPFLEHPIVEAHKEWA